MGPLLPLFARWAVVGVAMYVGSKIAEAVWENANEDGWISQGAKDSWEDMRRTWTGRKSDEVKSSTSKGYVPIQE